MIYRIEVGSWDSMSQPLETLAMLEGPEMDLKTKWEGFSADIEKVIGPHPQWGSSPEQQKDYDYKKPLWDKNYKQIHGGLKLTWGIPETEQSFLISRYFIAFLIKHYGFKEIPCSELYTEES